MENTNNKSGVFVLGMSDCNEKMCAAGGRISTQPGNALGIWEKSQDGEKNANLIDKVTRSGHNSVVEHIMFHLAFSDVSVIVEQFMIEFRLASFTVKSRRYVDFSDAGFYMPEISDESLKDEYNAHITSLFADYKALTDGGIPKEDARFVLPYCFFSNFFCSLNGREMLHVLHAMLHGRGKDIPEIYAIGEQLLEQVRQAAPGIVTGFEERKPKAQDTVDLSFVPCSKKTNGSSPLAVLISSTENAEQTVAKAALLEQSRFSPEDISAALSDRQTVKRIIAAVAASSRPRALESVQFTFALGGLSLSTLTHFARHRIHSIQIPSLDSVDRADYIIPDTVKAQPEMLKIYADAFERNIAAYNKFTAVGCCDAARYLLLSGNKIDIVSTMNGREMLLFMKLRSCSRAQWEIQIYANEMLRILREKAPDIFSLYGPSCYTDGFCPEGRLTCGKAAEMKVKYGV